ncbi:MAG: type II toxin-antitoxin system RelE/ParE family toxin [Phycisphaerae bacterium]
MSEPKAKFSADASLDLAEIFEHIQADSPDAARRVVSSILEKAAQLATAPQMGRARSNLRKDARSYCVGTYVVFYEITHSGIGVLRVLHGARNPRPLLRNSDR